MSITEQDYLTVRRGGKVWVLLRSENHFHMVAVDTAFTEKNRRRLMKCYPCDRSVLESWGLTVVSVRRENLRHITVTGEERARKILLNREEFELGNNYSEAFLRRFFEGHPMTVRISKWEGMPRETIRNLTLVLNFLALSSSVAMFFAYGSLRLWAWICLCCVGAVWGLCTFQSDSFHLTDYKNSDLFRPGKRPGNLIFVLWLPAFALEWQALRVFAFPGKGGFWLAAGSAVVCLILGIPLILNS